MRSLTVRQVTTSEDRERVFQMRYNVYVLERKVRQNYADHEKRQIREPLDPPVGVANITDGLILGAFHGSDLLGTLRLNGVGAKTVEYNQWYCFEQFGVRSKDKPTITTKLCVAQTYRGSGILKQLAVEVFSRALKFGSKVSFIDCNAPLLKMFRRLGFRQAMPACQHPEYGVIHPMCLIMHDAAHLSSVRSPFLVHQSRINARCPSVHYYRRQLKQPPSMIQENQSA